MLPPADWYPDPGDPHRLRYWDGARWTDHVVPWRPTAPVHTYRSARSWAIASCLLVVLVAVACCAVAVAAGVAVDDPDNGGLPVYVGLLVAVGGLQVAAYPFTCLWLWQTRENAEALNPRARHSRSRGWIWGGWVTPFVSFWFPFQVIRDIRDATRPRGAGGGLIEWWWLFWVLFLVTGRVAVAFDYGTSNLAQAEMWDALFGVLAAVSWVGVVRTVTREQAAVAAQRG